MNFLKIFYLSIRVRHYCHIFLRDWNFFCCFVLNTCLDFRLFIFCSLQYRYFLLQYKKKFNYIKEEIEYRHRSCLISKSYL